MSVLFSVLLIFISFILQSSVFSHFEVAGIVPNLLIIVTASLSVMHGERRGLIVGFFCGLLLDIFCGGLLGFYAFIMMMIGFINGKFYGIFYPEEIKLPLALIFVSDLTYGIVIYITLFLLKGRFDFGYYFLKIIIPECLYTMVVTFVFYPLILKIDTLISGRDQRGDY
ncbi:MAG: rod shape-determining protein MreD [Acetatifactor sp.]|nr:rod shape-determining protein MreD [Acetatifactor sp.]